MTHATRFVAVAVLVALVLCVPVQAQTPEIDAVRVRSEAGDAEAQHNLGGMYANGDGVPQDDAEAVTAWDLMTSDGGSWRQFHPRDDIWSPSMCLWLRRHVKMGRPQQRD